MIFSQPNADRCHDMPGKQIFGLMADVLIVVTAYLMTEESGLTDDNNSNYNEINYHNIHLKSGS